MLDRVDMNVIDVALEIPVIADRVFPESTLPKREFSIAVAHDRRAHFHDRVSVYRRLINRHRFGSSASPRRQRHEDLQVIRQHHERLGGEGVRLPRCPKGRT